jgi:hypothetical protein
MPYAIRIARMHVHSTKKRLTTITSPSYAHCRFVQTPLGVCVMLASCLLFIALVVMVLKAKTSLLDDVHVRCCVYKGESDGHLRSSQMNNVGSCSRVSN